MMMGNGPVPRVGYSIETSPSLLRVASRNSAEGITPTGDEPMLNAYDGAYDAGCGAAVVFCCGVEPHPAAAIRASVRKKRFMKPPYNLHLNAKTGDRISRKGESASSLRGSHFTTETQRAQRVMGRGVVPASSPASGVASRPT